MGDVYINDAFGAAHRAHASTVGMVKFLESRGAGLLMLREVEFLGRLLGTVEHPPTGTEELSTDDEEAAVDVGDDDEDSDEDDSEVEDVVEAEHDTDLEVVSETTATDDVVPASDDPFDVFAASLGL